MGLLDWSLAAAGSEAVFSDFNGEGHRTGTYGGGRRGTQVANGRRKWRANVGVGSIAVVE